MKAPRSDIVFFLALAVAVLSAGSIVIDLLADFPSFNTEPLTTPEAE